jgi:alanyl-tRNA synthetase
VGYDRTEADGKVLALVADGEMRDELAQGVEGILVLDQTPFYAEMGGQVADHGVITGSSGTFQVTDVQKNKGGKFMHSGKVLSGTISVGDAVTAAIDTERRKAIRRAHSATHLLDAALKKVLGDHVHQAGSLVEPDRLRFDFTHFEAITPEQLAEIDRIVNDAILEGYPVVTEVLPIEEAKKKGAVAMFGEKYGDIVRVVEMGGFSMEFCGGTHLDNTAKAGTFRIKSEGSVASGVRRIEATVGQLSLDTMNRNQEMLFHAAQVFKTTPGELVARAEQQMTEMKALRHELDKFKAEASLGEARQYLTAAKEVAGVKVLTVHRDGMDANALRQMGDFLRDKAPDVVAVLSSVNGGKITFLAVCGPEAVKKGIKAGDLVKSVCAVCGGKGGGKPDSAMGGGKDPSKLGEALGAVAPFVSEKLGQ